MTIKIWAIKGGSKELLEFPTLTEGLNHIGSRTGTDTDYYIQINPAEASMQRCPKCGKDSYRYYHNMDSMCCESCGYMPRGDSL